MITESDYAITHIQVTLHCLINDKSFDHKRIKQMYVSDCVKAFLTPVCPGSPGTPGGPGGPGILIAVI